ncbi:PhzF family phenazine biosynthesis protein [Cognatishimia sp. SS12]|uniref:PhzF family phenazine biosynthesis protein n=1 Tax=Cognatishimia sp. SS12 TaxID=2979465 RepID=UPI00232C5E8F|nr:PhzF family phenazine biosynthesis protein [Cognatishimia sp. SS12]MDC0737320.1 PhzF family phenazine biosynthesis protein [Cognatishimia sp. SS12]
MTQYFVYDVFTDQAFGGNPLAVIPDATALPEADLPRIAREFNFSETTFIYPPEDRAHTARVRIFTPTMEIPFAGHPLIGTTLALYDIGEPAEMVLELGVGPLRCWVEGARASFTTAKALERVADIETALVARALGLSEEDITTTTHAPVLATLGLPFVISELTSRAALARIQTHSDAFREGAARYPAGLDFSQFAYVRNGQTVDARMFAPLDNIPEDPATGSACATLAALLAEIEGKDLTLRIHQGDDMGRPSVIEAMTKGKAVTLSGTAKRIMQGTLVY